MAYKQFLENNLWYQFYDYIAVYLNDRKKVKKSLKSLVTKKLSSKLVKYKISKIPPVDSDVRD